MKYNPNTGSQSVAGKEMKKLAKALREGGYVTNPEADKTTAYIVEQAIRNEKAI